MRDYVKRLEEICDAVRKKQDRNIIIYGAGTNGTMIHSFLHEQSIGVYAYMDGRVSAGQVLNGIPVIPSGELKKGDNFYFIVSTLMESYTKEINAMLDSFGYLEGSDYINMCQEHFFDDKPAYEKFDPFLGYSKTCNWNSEKKTIIVLGNSTSYYEKSEKSIYFEPTWTDILQENAGSDYQVVNLSFPAYTTAQELLKLIRDGVQYKPHMVVALNGLVDAEHVRTLPGYPFYTRYQKEVLEQTLSASQGTYNGMLRLPRKVELGERDNSSYAEIYLRNITMMHGICQSLAIEYYVFLQPTLFFDNSSLNEKEKKIFDYLYPLDENACSSEGQKVNFKARKDAGIFLKEVKEKIQGLDYVYDITDIFFGKKDVYKDARHYTSAGHKIVGNKIASILKKRLRPQ